MGRGNRRKSTVAACQQWQNHPKNPLKKKIRVNKTEMSAILGMAVECQQKTDENQWTTVRSRGKSSASLHHNSLELLKHPGTQGTVVPAPAVCLALTLAASSSHASTATTQPTSSSRDKTCTLSSSIITNKLGTCERASDDTDLRD